MAYRGVWGTFYHIPKCGGVALRSFLRSHYHDPGTEIGNRHTLPQEDHDLTNAWTVVRHPAEWLLSYYAYVADHDWQWDDCPSEISDLFRFAEGMFWPMWVNAVAGLAGKVYGLYCLPGMKVRRLEEIDKLLGEAIPAKNVTEIKPVMLLEHWKAICEAEHSTLVRYGYDDTPTEIVRIR